MNTEIKKRLEEAAVQHAIQTLAYFAQHNQTPTHFDWADKVKEEYIAGAEHGYKEAVVMAKGWLEKKAHFAKAQWCNCEESEDDYYNGKMYGLEEALADFEADMNKLWEGEK